MNQEGGSPFNYYGMKSFDNADNFLEKLTIAFALIGGGLLMFMMVLGVIDVSGRSILSKPIPGNFEITELLMSALVSFGYAYCAVRKGHVTIDIAVGKLPVGVQNFITLLTDCATFCILVLISYQTAIHAIETEQDQLVTGFLSIPVYPFVWVTAFGFSLFSTVLLFNILRPFLGNRDGN
ncbi:MAG: TRAP transporter small permease [Proteobacteria bacterium]|nr:TRAP transporter small permease [Pseudomonadota bacterium]